ncbi:MAG: hypothetical protein V7637_954 [Mycobacteriales bacterium]|jgi:hypothetical protein
MVSWADFTAVQPDLAGRVWALLAAHKHKVLATVRADGSPRVSGIEVDRKGDWLWLGSMPGARKARDMQRDPRFALHAGSPDPPDDPAAWLGDAKLSGRAVEVTDAAEAEAYLAGGEHPPGPAHVFRLDVSEVVLTRVGDPADHLVIEFWREGADLRRITRK